jgi:uncharacterized protein YecE (DUF72 family)
MSSCAPISGENGCYVTSCAIATTEADELGWPTGERQGRTQCGYSGGATEALRDGAHLDVASVYFRNPKILNPKNPKITLPIAMIWIGTSGYNYPEWKGSFYPSDLPAAKMLPYYAARFPTVEINYTFYRMPNEKLVAGWATQTPSPYKLTLKAPRRITHDARLKNCGSLVAGFCLVAGTLGEKLGALLFQLPPNLKKDLALLDAFLDELPRKASAAFEFRHLSWLDDEVFGRLAARNFALCVADSEKMSTPVRMTADYAYFRLRDEGYTPDDISRWAYTIARETASCREVFVYFKHEEEGKGPEFAKMLRERLNVLGV